LVGEVNKFMHAVAAKELDRDSMEVSAADRLLPSKLVSLRHLADIIPDGASVALGGSFLHRGPFALVRELLRAGRKNLEIIKPSPGYDIDILCRAGKAIKIRCGIVAMEGPFGLAPWYRKAVESGSIVLEEHACATLAAGLRAAAFGVPFQPVGGVHGSDLARLNNWACLPDPYGSGKMTWVIPSIQPDFAVIHAAEVTESGDARVFGTPYWDRLLTRAAKRVLVTADRLGDEADFVARPEITLVPRFMTTAAAIVPGGAWPGSCAPFYGVDYGELGRYMENAEEKDLFDHLERAPECVSFEFQIKTESMQF
jgi:glutaconate CoA-transferase subunit A